MPPETTPCPSCSAGNTPGSRFCSNCGGALDARSGVLTVAAPPARVGHLVSSDRVPVGGFTPGTVLADRYRVVGLLGRGGMGEVYRADDLKLGQIVALKFLPDSLGNDPVRRERFFAEVRIARQIAHPNICRVYDIAEAAPASTGEGRAPQAFLSMEFIDGEDLDSLLRRIGHLSNEKALDIARQLAAGLAAAHERGVLHRDLKPSNIMLDGRGHVRITDFGLAVAGGDEGPAGEISGTPAYMAPEQLAGKGATVRSDIYALGLVLYELCTGKRAFKATSIAELREQKEHQTPMAPSELRADIDPVVERLILRCLEKDPGARPGSVAQLAAALPGGDPLAAAIAAGETPSPDLLIAAGPRGALRPAVALALVAVVVAGVAMFLAAGERLDPARRAGLTRSREALIDRAREFIGRAGYGNTSADSASGFFTDVEALAWATDVARADRERALEGAGVWGFFYRESPRPIVSSSANAGAGPDDPPMQHPGEVVLQVDGSGRLRSFRAIPSPETPDGAPPEPDWSIFFQEAGLDMSQWTAAEPERTPSFFADQRSAWQDPRTEEPDVPTRVEAAAYRGRPVSFAVIGPWTPSTPGLGTVAGVSLRIQGPFLLVLVSIVIAACVVARRNLRIGRGDRRGATRLALAVLALRLVSWAGIEHHVATADEYSLLALFLGTHGPIAALMWVFYIAVEPFVRRRWPRVLLSWTRLFAGDWRDPIVGRDVLIGCATAAVVSALDVVPFSSWVGYSAPLPFQFGNLNLFDGPLPLAGVLAGNAATGVSITLVAIFVLLLLRLLLRHDWATVVGAVLILGVFPIVFGLVTGLGAFLAVITTIVEVVILMRVGLLAAVAYFVVGSWLDFAPLTTDTSAWYAGIGYVVLALVGVLTLYGFRTATAGRPLLGTPVLDD